MPDEPTDLIARLQQNISSVVLGKADAVRLVVVALLAGEHVLLEDVPGVGKTLVGKAIARSLAGFFHRIQFTSGARVHVQSGPDLRQRGVGRRDQPRHAPHAERIA